MKDWIGEFRREAGRFFLAEWKLQLEILEEIDEIPREELLALYTEINDAVADHKNDDGEPPGRLGSDHNCSRWEILKNEIAIKLFVRSQQ